ncbi:MAG: hypothetical protein KJ065_09315 [Anaerolineae bacterium]|nr:hypothetical protein [Anaerolineae bacterium]
MQSESFLDWVQMHERAWGEEFYTGRPGLQQIMEARCVTFWRPMDKDDKHLRYKIRLYDRQADIEHDLLRILLRSHLDAPREKIARIFVNQEPYRIKSVRITLEKVDPST